MWLGVQRALWWKGVCVIAALLGAWPLHTLRVLPVVLVALTAASLLAPHDVAHADHSPVYVSPTGDDEAAGTSEAPFATLQAAIDHLGAGGGVINLAAGTYSGTSATIGAGATFSIVGACTAGTPTTTLQGNGAATVLAVIAGDVALECLEVTGGGGETDGAGLSVGAGAKVHGRSLSISGNAATGFGFGGAVANNGSLTLEDSAITGNSAAFGGAVYNVGTLRIRNSTIGNNDALGMADFGLPGMGAGLYLQDAAVTEEVILDEVTFTGNDAGDGGAIYVAGGYLAMFGGTVTSNTAAIGAGISTAGGASTFRGVSFHANNGTPAHVSVTGGTVDLEWNYWNNGAGLAPGEVTEASVPTNTCPTAACEAALTLAFDEASDAGTVSLSLAATETVFAAYNAMRTALDPGFSLFTPSASCASAEAPCVRTLPLGMSVNLNGPGGAVSTSWAGCADTVTIATAVTCTATLSEQILMRLLSTGDDYPTLADALAAAAPGDTIQLPAAEYASTSVTITQDVTIAGTCDAEGAPQSVLRPSGANRIMTVQSDVTVSVDCVQFTGATANVGGGAILNMGDLTLDRVEVTGNTSTHSDGGGGIRNQGAATLHITNSKITNNQATTGRGGGIYVFASAGEDGVVSVKDSVISGNTSDFGGGISIYGMLVGGGVPHGPLVVLDNTTVESNTAVGDLASTGGGAIFNQWARVFASHSAIRDNDGYSGGAIWNDGVAWLLDTDVTTNDATGDGGGILNHRYLVMLGGSVTDNQADGDGGGVAMNGNTQALRGVTLDGNAAGGAGEDVFGLLDGFPYWANFALEWNYWPDLQAGDIDWGDVTSPPGGKICADADCRVNLDLEPGAGGTLTLRPYTAEAVETGGAIQFLHQLHAASLTYAVGSDAAQPRIGPLVRTFPADLGLPALAGVGDGTCSSAEGCALPLPLGTTYIVGASALENYEFDSWTGPNCAASDDSPSTTDRVDVASAIECGAQFNALGHTLDVTRAGSGSGSVESAPAGIECGDDCSELYPLDTEVTLTATAAVGSTFAGWSGDADCTDGAVTMSADADCTATFNLIPYDLTVTLAGDGAGTVTSAPAGLNCGETCEATFDYGSTVTLTATPADGSVFLGWTGDADCSDGALAISSDASCTATFVLPATSITLTTAGGETEATIEAGGTVDLVVTMRNAEGDATPHLDGAQSVVFAGLSSSPAGDDPVMADATWGAGTLTVDLAFTDGVASAALQVFDAGVANLIATSEGFDSAAFDLTVTHAAGERLSIAQQPSATAAAGVAFATQPVVQVLDAYGNLVTTGADATVEVTAGLEDGTLAGDATVAAAGGVASFGDLAVQTVGAGQALEFSATLAAGQRSATSEAFTITAGLPAQIVVVTQPSGTGVGDLVQQPVVEVRDAFGNVVTTDPDGDATEIVEVTLESGSAGAVLGGTKQVAVTWATGRATFAGLDVDRPGDYTLAFQPTAAWGDAAEALGAVNSEEFTVPAATLVDLSIAPYLAYAGNTAGMMFSFETVTPIPAMGWFTVTLPAGYTLTEHDTYNVQVGDGFVAIDSVSIVGQTATFVFVNPVAAGSTVSMGPMAGVTNPTTLGLTGTYLVETRTAEGVLLDSASAPGTVIGAGDIARFEITVNDGNPVTAGVEFGIAVRAYDAWDNLIDRGTEVTLSFSTDAGEAPIDGWEPQVADERGYDFGGGVLEVEDFTFYDASETPRITVTRVGGASSQSAPIEVLSGTVAPAAAIITSSEAIGTTAQTATITVRLFDVLGNAMETGGETVVLTSTHGTLSPVRDVGDGTYRATLSASAVGDAVVSATVNGVPVTTGDATVEFTEPPVEPEPDPPADDGDVIEETGEVMVPVTGRQTTDLPANETAVVETGGPDGSTVKVTVPPAALGEDRPEGLRVEVAVAEDKERVAEQAPPPPNADVVTQFVVRLVDSQGNAQPANFTEPVSIEFTVPADEVPQDADLAALVLVFWNGEAWVEVEAVATSNEDGSVTLVSQVMHFSLYGVLWAPPEWGSFEPVPAAGLTLTRWHGGGWTRLEAALGTGGSVWRFIDGEAVGYIAGAPAWVNRAFIEAYPDGLPAGSPTVVRR